MAAEKDKTPFFVLSRPEQTESKIFLKSRKRGTVSLPSDIFFGEIIEKEEVNFYNNFLSGPFTYIKKRRRRKNRLHKLCTIFETNYPKYKKIESVEIEAETTLNTDEHCLESQDGKNKTRT